jgi:bifunctional DNA-binding transcriptional regulator/antitoxin component of YhaV-PrlF toxin-antitoxin module
VDSGTDLILNYPEMSTVILSETFDIRIPQDVRDALELTPGEELHVMQYAGRIEFVPVRKIQSMRGFLAGMDTEIKRDEDRL